MSDDEYMVRVSRLFIYGTFFSVSFIYTFYPLYQHFEQLRKTNFTNCVSVFFSFDTCIHYYLSLSFYSNASFPRLQVVLLMTSVSPEKLVKTNIASLEQLLYGTYISDWFSQFFLLTDNAKRFSWLNFCSHVFIVYFIHIHTCSDDEPYRHPPIYKYSYR